MVVGKANLNFVSKQHKKSILEIALEKKLLNVMQYLVSDEIAVNDKHLIENYGISKVDIREKLSH